MWLILDAKTALTGSGPRGRSFKSNLPRSIKSSSYGFQTEAFFFIVIQIDKFDTRMRSAIPASAEIALEAFVPRSYTSVVLTVTLVGQQDARRQGTVAL
jgi:hypothetical protein